MQQGKDTHTHLRKDKLLDLVRDLCKDEHSHERLCRAALGGRTAVEVRQILRYWSGTACSRMNKRQCIDVFIQMSTASASHGGTPGHSSTASASHVETPGLSSASAPTVEKSDVEQFAMIPFVKPKAFLKRLYRRWARHDLSSKIKAALKARSWSGGVLIGDIRRIVSEQVGADLETGRRRQFFERRLMMRLQEVYSKRRYRKRAARQAETGVGADDWPPQAQREHFPMQYEDYLSRRAWRAPS